MRTVRCGSRWPPHSMALVSSSRNACATDSRTSTGSVASSCITNAATFADFERAGRDDLDPLRTAETTSIGRQAKAGAARRSLTISTIAARRKRLADETAVPARGTIASSVSGVSSAVIMMTGGGAAAIGICARMSRPLMPGRPMSSSRRSTGSCCSLLKGLPPVARLLGADSRPDPAAPAIACRSAPVVVDDEHVPHGAPVDVISEPRC